MFRVLRITAILLLVPSLAGAADFFVDPQLGDPAGDGSAERPWQSLQEVIDSGKVDSQTWASLPYKKDAKRKPRNAGAPITGGDTIWLRSGDYGQLVVTGYYNNATITITAAKGQTPRFRSIRLRSGSHWTLRGLHVSPEFGQGKKARTLIDIQSHGWHGPVHDILVEDCVLRSAEDTSTWTADQWNGLSCNGINADGTRIAIRRNRLTNVDSGISVGASHALVEHNTIENFSGDGLRGLGDHSVFQFNVVKNCYDVNDNHDDGFQSWSHGPAGVGTGEVVGLVLRGNTIINYEDPHQPHRGSLQGIGCFDGMFVDWIIENNVIIVDHYHGITLAGARGCRIVNNTVADPNEDRPGPAALRIANHKDGTPSTDCIVRNNLVAALHPASGHQMVIDHNLMVEDSDRVFVNPAAGDLRLKETSPAVDAGSADFAPETDIAGVTRPQGAGVDIGAHEFSP